MLWTRVLLMLAAAGLAAQGQAPRDFTREKEVALGRGLLADLRRQSPPIEDEPLQAYIAALVERLNVYARNAFALSADLTREMDQREVTALPGGFLRVPWGALLAAESEAELAGVLAHGLAHVVSRHATRDALRGQTEGLATIPLIFVGHAHGPSALLIPTGFVPFQRKAEIEADRLAAQWMSQAGYPPAAYAAYVERLAVQDATERLEAIRQTEAPAHLIAQNEQFQAMQERARALGNALAPPLRRTKTTPPTLRRNRPGLP